MKVGFTGTRQRLTSDQYTALFKWIAKTPMDEFHHGGCLGADATAVDIVDRKWGKCVIHMYPCHLRGMTSENASRLSQVTHDVKPPLDRNRDIVNASDVLLACPDGPERVRSGTWSTVRFARKLNRHIVIVWPNGTVTEENG